MLIITPMSNILIVGSGAREHAIVRAFKRSPQNPSLFCFASSNNPGIKNICVGYEAGKITEADTLRDEVVFIPPVQGG